MIVVVAIGFVVERVNGHSALNCLCVRIVCDALGLIATWSRRGLMIVVVSIDFVVEYINGHGVCFLNARRTARVATLPRPRDQRLALEANACDLDLQHGEGVRVRSGPAAATSCAISAGGASDQQDARQARG